MEPDVENEESDSKEQDQLEASTSLRDFVLRIIDSLIEKIIPSESKALTLKEAGKYLSVLGKVWNLSEYPPTTFVNEELCVDPEEKLMDMEGYVDEYQYLHFEAVDKLYTNIQVLPKHFPWLISVDLSGSSLNNTMACLLTKLPNLVALRLNRNQFRDPYLPPLKHLQYLGLNRNSIESLHRIYHPNLETLDVNFNFIEEVKPEDCWKLSKLTQLELRGNQLKTTGGIEYISLVKLYLAQNRITKLEGLQILTNLQRLHLRDNPLSDLTGFSESNINLKYLNVRQCKIENVEDFRKLRVLKGLRELILKGNVFNPEPEKKRKRSDVEDDDDDKNETDEEEEEGEEERDETDEGERESDGESEYRIQILSYLPLLLRIDKKTVTREEVAKMREFEDPSSP